MTKEKTPIRVRGKLYPHLRNLNEDGTYTLTFNGKKKVINNIELEFYAENKEAALKLIKLEEFQHLTIDNKIVKMLHSPFSFGFDEALNLLKQGVRLQREGWNGKNMYIYYVPESSYPAQTEIAKTEFGEMVPYRAYLAIKTVDNKAVPWVASQSDILATDWRVI